MIPKSRYGTTLAELLVALTILGTISSALLRSLSGSIRTVNAQTAAIERRGQLQAASHVTESLIATAAPTEGDFQVATDTSATFYSTLGIALACRTAANSAEVVPQSLTSGLHLSALVDAPKAGDVAVIFNNGALQSTADDHWTRHTIVGVHSLTGACASTSFTQPGDASKVGWTLDLTPPPPSSAIALPLRILRPQRLALYKSAQTWMLGLADGNAITGSWNVIQPVAGPLTDGSVTSSGLQMVWLDSTGVRTTTPSRIAALNASFRAISVQRSKSGHNADSVELRVTFRNRQ